jgi:hypothetical protein
MERIPNNSNSNNRDNQGRRRIVLSAERRSSARRSPERRRDDVEMENEINQFSISRINQQNVGENHQNNNEIPKNSRMLMISKLFTDHVIETYVCNFCKQKGHHAGKCPVKIASDKLFKKDPVLSKQWGEYKFSKVDLEARKKKNEYLTSKMRVAEEKAEKKLLKKNKLQGKISQNQHLIEERGNSVNQSVNINQIFAQYLQVTSDDDSPDSSNFDASARVIDITASLYPRKHEISLQDETQQVACIICMAQFLHKEIACDIECKHYLHWGCLELYAADKLVNGQPINCPTCRRTIVMPDGQN